MINLRITILFVYNRYIIWSLLIEYQNPKQVLLVVKRIIYNMSSCWVCRKTARQRWSGLSGNPLGCLMETYNLTWLSSSSMTHVLFNVDSKPWFAMTFFKPVFFVNLLSLYIMQSWTCVYIQTVNNFPAVST